VTHLLVTNDFPPKVGGIQNYLYDLWKHLPPDRFAVLTTSQEGDRAFDRDQPFRIDRVPSKVLLPLPSMVRRVEALVRAIGATAVVLDPALPIGAIGRALSVPYGVVLHGAEVTVPGRIPPIRPLLRWVLDGASLLIAAGEYPLREARRAQRSVKSPAVVVPPGVDSARFVPLDPLARTRVRSRFALPEEGAVVCAMSRLVPRKGFDVLIEAAAALIGEGRALTVIIVGDGRDRGRLERRAAALGVPVRFLGRVPDADLPALLGAADLFAMCCRTRWLGLEQEGFGIVFLEAAAAGVPVIAGRSGGVGDAVVDGRTGLIVDRPADVVPVTEALRALLDSPERAMAFGEAGRERAVVEFAPATLAARLDDALLALESGR
jgi:phosphatidylinositol alpha-1,6-mannosyltransferase